MILWVSLVLPLLAVAVWWPLAGLSARARRAHVGAGLVLALAAMAIVGVWRSQWLSYAAVAWLQVLFGWLLLVFLLAALWVVLRELGWALTWLLRRRATASRLWHGAGLTHAVLALIVLAAGIGTWNGLKPPQLRERVLPVPGLPPALAGLRVAVLSDIHASPAKGAWRTGRIVEATLAARPDLIVLPGDMVDGEIGDSAAAVAPLARLQAPLGVWLAPGNHEYYHGYAQWMAHFRQLGLGVLENQSVQLDVRGARLAVSGIGDLAALKASSYMRGGLRPDLPAVLAQAAGADFHLLLAHQPKQARAAAASGAVDLQLSGHTHGGHILGLDRWVVAPANDGFVRGPYRVDGAMTLYVSAGAGQWDGFTARLGVPATIDVLELQPARE